MSTGKLMDGEVPPTEMASLMPAHWNQIASWLERIDNLRQAA